MIVCVKVICELKSVAFLRLDVFCVAVEKWPVSCVTNLFFGKRVVRLLRYMLSCPLILYCAIAVFSYFFDLLLTQVDLNS